MGLHGSQKRVISSAGSFPVLNNGTFILGFPGLSSVDFGIGGDCVHTLPRLVHLRHLFPPVSTLISLPVDWTQSASPDPHPSGPEHRHILDWEKGEALEYPASAAGCACVHVCAHVCEAIPCEGQDALRKWNQFTHCFCSKGRVSKGPIGEKIFGPLLGCLCSFPCSIMPKFIEKSNCTPYSNFIREALRF